MKRAVFTFFTLATDSDALLLSLKGRCRQSPSGAPSTRRTVLHSGRLVILYKWAFETRERERHSFSNV